jgi:hypothetical protein
MKNLRPAAIVLVLSGVALADDSTQRAAQAELVADASSRSSFAGADGASGWKNGKFSISDGGPNVLNIGGYTQLRYNGNFRTDQPDGDEYTGGFQVQRARLKMDGSVWNKALTYNVMTELSGSSGATLMDAEAKYTFENKTFVRMGQYKPVFNREELVSDTGQLDVERSVTNSVFTMARSQGIGIGWQNDKVRLGADITDGTNNLNTSWDSPKEADFAINGRAEWMFAGKDWKRFSDFTSWRGAEYAGLIGAAFDYESYGDTGGGAADKSLMKAAADVSVEGGGWNAFAAVLWQQNDPDSGEESEAVGVVAQAGVFVTEQVEVFGRYDGIYPNEIAGPDDFNTATVGANYYLSPNSNAVKLSADVIYYFDPEADCAIVPAPSTTLNLLPDSEGDQVAFRIQLQVVF